MASKHDTKAKPDTGTPMGPGTSEAPLVIKTQDVIPEANVDPRGDNRPGVLPDQPAQEGIDPVTNLREDLVDPVTHTPLAASAATGGEPLNLPVQPSGAVEEGKKPSTRMVRMRATSDIWPTQRPKDFPEDREYRIRAGEEVDLPEDEAMDRMEAGTAVRVDRRR